MVTFRVLPEGSRSRPIAAAAFSLALSNLQVREVQPILIPGETIVVPHVEIEMRHGSVTRPFRTRSGQRAKRAWGGTNQRLLV